MRHVLELVYSYLHYYNCYLSPPSLEQPWPARSVQRCRRWPWRNPHPRRLSELQAPHSDLQTHKHRKHLEVREISLQKRKEEQRERVRPTRINESFDDSKHVVYLLVDQHVVHLDGDVLGASQPVSHRCEAPFETTACVWFRTTDLPTEGREGRAENHICSAGFTHIQRVNEFSIREQSCVIREKAGVGSEVNFMASKEANVWMVASLEESCGHVASDGLGWDFWETRRLRWRELGMIERGKPRSVGVPWTQMDLKWDMHKIKPPYTFYQMASNKKLQPCMNSRE